MGNLFAPEKPLKEVIRENQRLLKKSIRELEKEIKNLESNEKKLIAEIKKSAKANQMVICFVLSRQFLYVDFLFISTRVLLRLWLKI